MNHIINLKKFFKSINCQNRIDFIIDFFIRHFTT